MSAAEHRHRFANAEDALAYIAGGHGRVTLVSHKTGDRFTYKFGKPEQDPGDTREVPVFVGLLSGPDNEGDYQYLGNLWTVGISGLRYAHGRKSKAGPDAPSVAAFGWMLALLMRGKVPEKAELWHEGRCGRCGRTLTVPESIERGMGPVCAARAAGRMAA